MYQSNLLEAQKLLNDFLPKTGKYYSKKRNYTYDIDDNTNTTSLLSPYIRYRLISEEEVLKKTLSIQPFLKSQKFIEEIYWRTYWKGWLEHRKEVYDDYLNERDVLIKKYHITNSYIKAINGETDLDFFNNWVNQLKTNGYLHNHVRMWFASIWIFTLNLPWQLGANFFMENLLDGDPASNTLSWKWVAGLQTKGKHYLARKDNISKFSNINIKKEIELNENANYLNENKNYIAKDINFKIIENNNLEAIIIPSDELNFIQSNKYEFKKIFSGVPINDYNDHNFSAKVITHLKRIIISNFKDNELYNDCKYVIHFDNYYKNFNNWIKKNKIKEIALPYVTKGNWNKIYKKLMLNNPSINFVYLHRKYDKYAWQFSKKGFFNFKRHIPKLITRL